MMRLKIVSCIQLTTVSFNPSVLDTDGDRKGKQWPVNKILHQQSPEVLFWKIYGDLAWDGVISGKEGGKAKTENSSSNNLLDSAYLESGLGVAPWLPKRVFGGTPVSTEWFSDIPTDFGLPMFPMAQEGYLDWLKRSRRYILLYNSYNCRSSSTSSTLLWSQ